jgi:hypothetical protein
MLRWQQGRYADTLEPLEQALTLHREDGDLLE